MMNYTIKPRVVLSRCIEQSPCRYNGEMISCEIVRKLSPFVEWIPVCPEVEIGLGVPRTPINIISDGITFRLVGKGTRKNWTAGMTQFTEKFLNSLPEIDGFILKSKSPSCGLSDVKIYPDENAAEEGKFTGKGIGIFSQKILEKFGDLALIDEKKLQNPIFRNHFLVHIFTFASFRRVKSSKSETQLKNFYLHYKPLFDTVPELNEKMEKLVSPFRTDSIQIFEGILAQIFKVPRNWEINQLNMINLVDLLNQ